MKDVLATLFWVLIVVSCIIVTIVAVSSINENSEYHFDGNLDGEQVKFYERDLNTLNLLEVTKANGVHVKYRMRNPFKVTTVKITIGGVTKTYVKDEEGWYVVKIAQKQVEAYLGNIKATKARIEEARMAALSAKQREVVNLLGEVPGKVSE